MDGITQYQGDSSGNRLGFENEPVIVLRLLLDAQFAGASLEVCGQGSVQLVEVLAGPFDL
jgi:hypothetical protein